MDDKIKRCVANEETVYQACWALMQIAEYSTAKKGIVSWQYVNMKTDKLGRHLYGAKSTDFPDGLIFNFCPYCGEKHPGAYRMEKEEAA